MDGRKLSEERFELAIDAAADETVETQNQLQKRIGKTEWRIRPKEECISLILGGRSEHTSLE